MAVPRLQKLELEIVGDRQKLSFIHYNALNLYSYICFRNMLTIILFR
jgi:hypothetical protein